MEKKIERAARHCGVSELSKSSMNATNEIIVWKRLSEIFRTSLALSTFSTAFAMSWVKEHAADESCQRVMAYLLARMNYRRTKCKDTWQRGCPQIIPGLRASNFWDPDQFEWINKLRCAFPKIREEVLALRSSSIQKESGFQPYRAPSSTKKDKQGSGTTRGTAAHDSGEWNIYYLYLHNIDFSANRERVPETVKLLKSIPRFYDHAMFSNLASTTHVTKHHGPTNKKLRIHLPLYVPEEKNSCRLRVGDETRASAEGRVVVFDDSFEHEAWNDSKKSRVVLIFDIWHPDLSDQEVKFLSFIQKAQLRAESKRLEHIPEVDRESSLFSIIESNRSVRPSEKILWKM
mgnify:FL=1